MLVELEVVRTFFVFESGSVSLCILELCIVQADVIRLALLSQLLKC